MNESPTIIVLDLVRPDRQKTRCQHRHIEVDETLAQVICRDCGQGLNPVNVLASFARRDATWKRQAKTYNECKTTYEAALAALQLRNRTKCMHCGKMTSINRKVPSGV